MITRIRRQLFSLRYAYTNPIDAQRAGILLIVNVAIVVLSLATTFLLLIPSMVSSGTIDFAGLSSSVIVIVAAFISHRLIQNGRLRIASWIIIVAITLGTLSGVLFGNDGQPTVSSNIVIFVSMPVFAASVLLDRRGFLTITLLTIVVVVIAGISQTANFTPVTYIPANDALGDMTLILMGIIFVVAIALAFLGSLQRIASETFVIANQRKQISQLGLDLASARNESELTSTALNGARQIFNQRFIELYLVNDEGNLILQSASGQRRTLIRSIDSNIIAESVRSRSLLTTNLQDDPARHTHMAASTSFALAVPIIVNSEVLGVLDIQDTTAFSHNEPDTFQHLAGQVGIALQRVRLTTGLQTRVEDQDKTIQRLQTQLADFSRRQQQNVSTVWGSYIQGRGKQAIGYTLDNKSAVPVQANDLPITMNNALKNGQLDVSQQGNEQIVNVPIRFRDTNLGAMSFHIPADQPLSERQIEVATIVAERLALALENTRLFEQSQSQALRERKASEVSAALIGATDVRVVLNMAAEQFKEALGAVNTRIFIQPETMMEPLAQTQEAKD